MYPDLFTMFTSLSSRSSHAAADDDNDDYTLPDILDTLGPILGGLPTGLSETHHARKGHNFLTPTSFYLLVYITMLIALVYKLAIRQTGSWRQLSLPFAFSLARCAYWGLRFARVGKAVHPAKDLDQLTQRDFALGYWFEQAALILPCGVLVSANKKEKWQVRGWFGSLKELLSATHHTLQIFSSMMLFGDAMVGYQPRTAVARWMLKHWGSKGKVSSPITYRAIVRATDRNTTSPRLNPRSSCKSSVSVWRFPSQLWRPLPLANCQSPQRNGHTG